MKYLLGIFLLMFFTSIKGQDTLVTLTGKVVNVKGIPIQYASVVSKGKGGGVTANQDGVFTIKIKKGTTIRLSSVNYIRKEIIVNQSGYLLIVLDEEVYEKNIDVNISNIKLNENYEIDKTNKIAQNKIYDVVEIFSEFPRNVEKFINDRVAIYLTENDNVTLTKGITQIKATIERDGTIKNIEILKSVSPANDSMFVKGLKAISGKCKPAIQNGGSVATSHIFNFRIYSINDELIIEKDEIAKTQPITPIEKAKVINLFKLDTSDMPSGKKALLINKILDSIDMYKIEIMNFRELTNQYDKITDAFLNMPSLAMSTQSQILFKEFKKYLWNNVSEEELLDIQKVQSKNGKYNSKALNAIYFKVQMYIQYYFVNNSPKN